MTGNHLVNCMVAFTAAILLPVLVSGCAGAAESADNPTPTYTAEEQLGKRLFTTHCSSCHSTIPGSIVVGPSMAGVARRAASRMEGVAAREYLKMSIEQPGAYVVEGFADLMPVDIAESLSEEEMDAIISYLLRLDE